MDIVILAAGRGSRLAKYLGNDPKPFIRINNEPIICRLLRQLARHRKHFDNVIIVTGYLAEKFNSLPSESDLDIKVIVNEEWESKNNAFSFAKAFDSTIRKEVLVIEADGVFSDMVIDQIFASMNRAENILFSDFFQGYTGCRFVVEGSRIMEMAIIKKQETPLNKKHMKSIGVMKLGEKLVNRLLDKIAKATIAQYNWYLDNFITEEVQKFVLYTVNIYPGKWIEIDDETDYEKAKKLMAGE